MFRKTSVGWIIFAVILGALIGSAIGEVIGLLLPGGVVKDFFLRAIDFGFGPATLDLVLISVTLGFSMKLNIIGVIGIFLAAYILRWYV